jgi:hypothetical protein
MCDNLDVRGIQAKAFLPITVENPLMDCGSIRKVSLKRWTNEPLRIKQDDTTTSNQSNDDFNFNFF